MDFLDFHIERFISAVKHDLQNFRASVAELDKYLTESDKPAYNTRKGKHKTSLKQAQEKRLQCLRRIDDYTRDLREVERLIKATEYDRAFEAGPWC